MTGGVTVNSPSIPGYSMSGLRISALARVMHRTFFFPMWLGELTVSHPLTAYAYIRIHALK